MGQPWVFVLDAHGILLQPIHLTRTRKLPVKGRTAVARHTVVLPYEMDVDLTDILKR